eukprot:gnl/MRDRNA2_/MRDRNA2_107926_c0_seq1.p1 gnl/MRDRNA2_/MRDRNA2_107926_c0~~gnl/MRDRNA2_/MRDRNA2_107926_c0_seq1.p1  ORF type:complete len:695 (+),score=109.69 gnl/MRDRNA2_/MRDRNA2_107926_c0_seq1:111-2195(+)
MQAGYQDEGFAAHLLSMDTVQGLFCAGLFVSVLRTYRPLVRFYEWFYNSGLEISRHRGYGQTGCKAYGVLPSPFLSVAGMRASGMILMTSFFLLCVVSFLKLAPLPEDFESQSAVAIGVCNHGVQLTLLIILAVSYHCYITQLYCEAHVGAHVTVLVPPVLFLLACYHVSVIEDLVSGSVPDAEKSHKTQVLFAFLMKSLIAASYFAAGISKLRAKEPPSQENGNASSRWFPWLRGATLQGCIYEALFLSANDNFAKNYSFGVPTPCSNFWQRFAFKRPTLLCFFSAFGVFFEFLAPLVLCVHWLGPYASFGANLLPLDLSSFNTAIVAINVVFAACGIGFHYGIAMLQNVDFVSWWGPAYMVFFFDPAGLKTGYNSLQLSMIASSHAAMAAFAYVAVHAVFIFILRFTNTEMLPFSAFKMFSDLKNIFDPSKKKWMWITDKEHATGTLKNYCFPFCRPQCVTVSELNCLPFKYMVVGTGQCTGVAATGQPYINAKVNGSIIHIHTQEQTDSVSSAPASWNGNSSVTDSTHDESGDAESNCSRSSKENEKMVMNLDGSIVSPLPPLEQPLLGEHKVRSKRRDKNAREVGETNVSQPITVYTNVRLTRNMQQLLYRLHKQGSLGAEMWTQEAATEGALQLVDELRAEFRNCARLVPLNADGHADNLQTKVPQAKGDIKINPENQIRTMNDRMVGA